MHAVDYIRALAVVLATGIVLDMLLLVAVATFYVFRRRSRSARE